MIQYLALSYIIMLVITILVWSLIHLRLVTTLVWLRASKKRFNSVGGVRESTLYIVYKPREDTNGLRIHYMIIEGKPFLFHKRFAVYGGAQNLTSVLAHVKHKQLYTLINLENKSLFEALHDSFIKISRIVSGVMLIAYIGFSIYDTLG